MKAQAPPGQEPAQAGTAPAADARASSDGAMYRADLQRTGVYRTKGVPALSGRVWASPKLFTMKREALVTEFGRDVNLSGVGPVYFPGRDWRVRTSHNYSDPIVAGDTVFFGLYVGEGVLFALDAASGQIRWRARRPGGRFTSPCVAGDSLYVGTAGADGALFYAMNLLSQEERWRFPLGARSFVNTAPAVAHGAVYFGTSEGHYYALDASTGQKRWVFETGQKGYLTSPAVAGETVYFADQKNFLHALDAQTGRERWQLKMKEGVWAVAVADGTLYASTFEGQIYAVDAQAGRLVSPLAKGVKAGTPVAVRGGVVYFGGREGNVYAVDAATGGLRWKVETKGVCQAPVIAEGVVYYSCEGGKLNAVDAETGKLSWTLATGEAEVSTPVIAAGVLYFISDDGHVYAVK